MANVEIKNRHEYLRHEAVPVDFSHHVVEIKDFITKDNKLTIEVVDKQDVFQEIQSHKEECGLEYIVRQLVAQGTPLSVMAKDSPEIDVSELPEYIGEVFDEAQKGLTAKARLEGLAKEFGISYEQLLKEVNEGTINNVISKYIEGLEPKKEVKEDGK